MLFFIIITTRQGSAHNQGLTQSLCLIILITLVDEIGSLEDLVLQTDRSAIFQVYKVNFVNDIRELTIDGIDHDMAGLDFYSIFPPRMQISPRFALT